MDGGSQSTYMSSFVNILVGVVYLYVGVAHGAAPQEPATNKFCATAMDKPLCTKMVNGATNWNDAIKNGITSSIEHVKMMQLKTIPEVEAAFANKPQNSKKSTVAACNEDYDRIIKDLSDILARNDPQRLPSSLEMGLHLTDCLRNFSDFGVVVPKLLNSTSNELDLRVWNLQAIAKLQ